MLVVVLLAFVAGIGALQQVAELPAPALCAAVGVFGVFGATCGALARAPKQGQRRFGVAAGVAAILGAGSLGFAHAALLAHLRLSDELAFADEGRDIRLVGTIASLPAQLPQATRFEFAVEHVVTGGVRVPARIALAWYAPDSVVRPAERWQFTVRLRRPHGAQNPGGFDLEAWMFERNLRASGYVRDAPRRLAPFAWSFGGTIDRARDRLRDALRARLDGQRYGGVLVALVIGDQRAIADEDWQLFNRTGIAHLVSISGLHITMIAGLAAAGASLAWRRSRRLLGFASAQAAAAATAMTAAFVYCLLAGWGVPAQRTFFMLAIVCAALLVRSRPRAAMTLAFAAAVVCTLDPWAVVAPGFWLSFGAVAAIFHVVQGRQRAPGPRRRWREGVRDAAHVQIAVTIALVPLTIALFRQVSLVSPAANAIAIPVVSLLVTPLSLAAAGFVWLPEPLASFAVPLLAVAHALFAALADGLRVVGGWSWSSLPLPAPRAWAVVLAAAAVGWLLAPRGWPLRWIGVVGLLPLFLLPGERPRSGELWVTAIDVGQGMAVLVETRGHALLYDAGPRYGTADKAADKAADAGARLIVPYLRWRGIGALDWLVVSHLDADHSGGAASVQREIAVGRVLTSVPAGHAVLAGARDVVRCDAGQRFALGHARIEVLHPQAADHAAGRRADNAMSCVVRVDLGATGVLLTGDLPARQEAALLSHTARTADVHATLVSAPHHGSRHSSSEGFVDAVAPRWVLVQAGYRNRFGHPDAAVVSRWQRRGARVLRTDRAGAIQWRFGADGVGDVERWRNARARYWHNRPPAEPPEPASQPMESMGDPAAGTADGDARAGSVTGIEVATPPPAEEPEPF